MPELIATNSSEVRAIAESSTYENQQYIMDKLNEWLNEVYCVEYIGGFKVYKDDIRYSLYLNFLNQDRPMIIAGEFFSDEEFIEYLKKQMRERALFSTTQYFRLTRADL